MSKDFYRNVTNLSRVTANDLKRLLSIIRVVSLTEATDAVKEGGDLIIEVPPFGQIYVNKDLDFEFKPDANLKRDVFEVQQNPEKFLKKELVRLFNIGAVNE